MAQIYSLALYETRDPHAAGDITQAVFERALTALPGFCERALRALIELPPDRRQAVVLRFVTELPAREVGEIMGRSERVVRVLIHRALVTVRQRLAS